MAYRVRRGLDAEEVRDTKCVASASDEHLKSCARRSPSGARHVVFNLLEEFDGIVTYDQHVVAFLELLRHATPAAIRAACCCRATSRCASSCWPTTASHRRSSTVFRSAQGLRLPRKLKFPLFVKSTTEDASLGISQASIVDDREPAQARRSSCTTRCRPTRWSRNTSKAASSTSASWATTASRRCPSWEMNFGSLPKRPGGHRHAQREVGQEVPGKHGIKTGKAQDLSDEQTRPARAASRNAIYRALYMSGFARMDFRLRNDGRVFLLEANANPNLSKGEDLADSAKAAGMSYTALITSNRATRVGLTCPSGDCSSPSRRRSGCEHIGATRSV